MKSKFVCALFSVLMICLVATPALALKPCTTIEAKLVMLDAAAIFSSRDYDRFEKTLQNLLTTQEKVTDGQWKFHIFMDSVDGNVAQHFNDEAAVESTIKSLSDWSQQRPNSKFAKTALANAWLARAWLSRGKKAASETTQKEFVSFEKGLENARQVLQTIDFTPGAPNPEAHMALLLYGLGSGQPAQVMDDIYAKAIAEYPEYFYLTLQYLTSKFPRWTDDRNALQQALNSLGRDYELTARALWHLHDYGEGESIPGGEDAKVAREGFKSLQAKYHSPVTTQQMALFACLYWQDRPLFDELNAKIKHPDMSVWQKRETYDGCVNGHTAHAPEVSRVTEAAADFNDGPRARDALAKQVRKLFQDGKFAELDKTADEFRTKKSRFPDGAWKLQTFYSGFDMSGGVPEVYFPPFFDLVQKWREANPRSVTAQCVLAGAWIDYAWKARGDGSANTVTKEDWSLVRERLEKAWQIVNEPLGRDVADCPRRHDLRLILARTRGMVKEDYEQIFQEAIQKFPGYYVYYSQKAFYLLPKWHGEDGDWQKFITKVAEQNPGGEGALIYARTLWNLYLGNDVTDLHAPGISWPRMRDGFKDLDKNYPNSAWIINNAAKFACQAEDEAAVRSTIKRIDQSNYYPEAWKDTDINGCRGWIGLPPLSATSRKPQR